MSLVVDAPGERLEVQGFRFADAEGDADIWRRVWQDSDLTRARSSRIRRRS